MDVDCCMSTLPWEIMRTQKEQFWLILYSHLDATVFYFFRYDAYSMALTAMSCCLPNTIGQHRVSLIRWPHDGFAKAKMYTRIQPDWKIDEFMAVSMLTPTA